MYAWAIARVPRVSVQASICAASHACVPNDSHAQARTRSYAFSRALPRDHRPQPPSPSLPTALPLTNSPSRVQPDLASSRLLTHLCASPMFPHPSLNLP
eukprot:5055340-Pleurochrysis_carterae.AAC.1